MPQVAPSNSNCEPPSAGATDSSSIEEGTNKDLNSERTATSKDYLVRIIPLMANIKLFTHNFSESSRTEKHGTSSCTQQEWSLLLLLGSPCP